MEPTVLDMRLSVREKEGMVWCGCGGVVRCGCEVVWWGVAERWCNEVWLRGGGEVWLRGGVVGCSHEVVW